jgi:hypothetical protein
MSDQWIVLVPEDARFVPDTLRQARARDRLAAIAPSADELTLEEHERIHFFDCGSNLERIVCPSCQSELANDWWQARMSEDYDHGFLLASYATPCCNSRHTLADLDYQCPQAFGRFALKAMTPNIAKLSERHQQELEAILKTNLRVIYRHL